MPFIKSGAQVERFSRSANKARISVCGIDFAWDGRTRSYRGAPLHDIPAELRNHPVVGFAVLAYLPVVEKPIVEDVGEQPVVDEVKEVRTEPKVAVATKKTTGKR